MPENLRAYSSCVLQSGHQVGADILFEIAATDREHEHKIVRAQAADPQPSFEHRCPTFIVYPRRQFGHIVGGRVGFDARDLAEIVHGMRGVGRAASYS